MSKFGRATESLPLILVQDGEVLQRVLKKEHLSEEDILTAVRQSQGLERLDQIKWAVRETNGGISIVPKTKGATRE